MIDTRTKYNSIYKRTMRLHNTNHHMTHAYPKFAAVILLLSEYWTTSLKKPINVFNTSLFGDGSFDISIAYLCTNEKKKKGVILGALELML